MDFWLVTRHHNEVCNALGTWLVCLHCMIEMLMALIFSHVHGVWQPQVRALFDAHMYVLLMLMANPFGWQYSGHSWQKKKCKHGKAHHAPSLSWSMAP